MPRRLGMIPCNATPLDCSGRVPQPCILPQSKACTLLGTFAFHIPRLPAEEICLSLSFSLAGYLDPHATSKRRSPHLTRWLFSACLSSFPLSDLEGYT